VSGQTAVILAALITVALPILAAAILAGGDKTRLLYALLGAATFLVFEYLLRFPLLSLLSNESLSFILFSQTQPVLYPLALSLSAALFEEGGRYLALRFLVRRRAFEDGVAFGIGFGGVESIALVGLPLLSVLITKEDVSGAMVLISAAERVFTMVVHIAFSVMVLRGVEKKRVWEILAAFALHTVFNFIALALQVAGYPVYVSELFILGFMFFMLGYILYVRINILGHAEKGDAA